MNIVKSWWKFVLLLFGLFLSNFRVHAESADAAVNGLLKRVLPNHAKNFEIEIIRNENSKDVFEIEGKNDKIILRGNNSIAVASALNWYLKYECNVHLSWNGDQMKLPSKLPVPRHKERRIVEPDFRVYMNYCTFNYTASWWDWKRWEREIDFMAMNGINMPLSVVGLEGVWYNSLLRVGFTDIEARSFLVGPAYLAWQWMTNIQSHAGPLPKSWIDSHVALGKKILDRELELGMKPIQQGFSGYVPREFIKKFPDAKIKQGHDWCSFRATAQLDPLDPLFEKFGNVFLEEEKKLFGAHGYYAADPFHEGAPPVDTKEYLNAVGVAISKIISSFDSSAKWVMQAWSIRKDIATAVPKDKLLILDLGGSTWKRKEDFWDYNFVVGNLHNFGGRINMHGDIPLLASNQYQRIKQVTSNAIGSGLFMEGIMQNPVYYDLAFEIPFHSDSVPLQSWVNAYAHRRYGGISPSIEEAWKLLIEGPYRNGTNGVENSSIICARPALEVKKSGPNAGFNIPYDPLSLNKALELLLQNADQLKYSDGYRFDIVDIQRQVLSNLGQQIHKKAADAFQRKDIAAFELHSNRFIQLLKDVDQILSTRPELNFNKWLADGRAWGTTQKEKDLYEYNASLLVTQWGGDEDPTIFDYAWREWSGLINGYYLQRWQQFYNMLDVHLKAGTIYEEKGLLQVHGRESLRANEFYSKLADWETVWIRSNKKLTAVNRGKEIQYVNAVHKKYVELLKEYY